MNSMKQKIQAFFRVSRADLLIPSFGHATLGMILGASTLLDLFQINVLFYIFLHYSIAFFSCNINCYFDYHVDRHYKTSLSTSVDLVSKKWLTIVMIVEFIIALLLGWWFFIQGFILITILSLLGLFAGFAYSAEPLRMKKRGVLGPIMILFLYSLPIAGGWLVFQQDFTMVIIIFLVGYILMNEGFTLVNMCEDYEEDKKEGIETWAHHLGIKNTIRVAVVFSSAGFLCIIALVMKLIQFDLLNWVAIGMIIITGLLILKATVEVSGILRYDDLQQASKQYGHRLQRWFLMTRYPLIIAGILIII